MSRIAIIGYNSVELVNIIVNIWNQQNSVVMLDWRMPVGKVRELMMECGSHDIYIDSDIINKYEELGDYKIVVHQFSSIRNEDRYLTYEIYSSFTPNYSEEEAVVIFSSGTTGMAKGVCLSHFAINTNADAIIDYMNIQSNDVIYIVKSLTHSSTFVGELLVALKQGIPAIIGLNIVPPRYTLGMLRQYEVTLFCTNPTLLRMYVREIEKYPAEFPKLRNMYVSGAILSDELYCEAKVAFRGINICNMYGLSEAGPRVTCQTGHESKNTVGKPIKDVQIGIANEQGHFVNNLEIGEVYVHSKSCFSGYITDQCKREKTYWHKSGDIGYLTENEELVILGRKDDVINIDSHNVVPVTIENVVLTNECVDECSVVEVPKGIITCAITLKTDIDVNEVSNGIHCLCKKNLAVYEIPRRIIVLDNIPKNANGKVDNILLVKEINKKYGNT